MQPQSFRGVQQHEVNAAADALLAQQVRPTVERVRLRIGRGSPNTVGPMLECWFANLAPRLGLAGAETSQALPAALLQASEAIWKAALEEANAQALAAHASERERLAAIAAELEDQRAKLALGEQAALDRERLQQAAVERAQLLHDEAIAHLKQLEADAHERELALARSRERIAQVLEEKDTAIRVNADRLDTLAAELARMQQRAEGNERRLLDDLDRARQELKATQKRASEAAQRVKDLRAQAGRELAELTAKVRQLEVERATLAERLSASESRAVEYQARMEAALFPPTRRRSSRNTFLQKAARVTPVRRSDGEKARR